MTMSQLVELIAESENPSAYEISLWIAGARQLVREENEMLEAMAEYYEEIVL
jgi:hypothetical protein